MLIAFTLSMPGAGSWDGEWTSASRLFARVMSIRSKQSAQKLLDAQPYWYSFGDGWTAMVSVVSVDAKEARKLRKHSSGFCGYDWMIESIRTYQEIRTPSGNT